jgi:hypothetical protein
VKRGLAALGLALAFNAHAADESRWYVQLDNDVAFGTDRWYSTGARISRVSGDTEWSVVQEVYTPDAKNWDFGKVDRIPTARLFGSFARHDRSPGVFQTLELGLGVRGPAALGRQTTRAVHHVITAAHVDWSRQLDNRLDAHVAATRTQVVGGEAFKVHYGAQLGTQVAFAHAGFELRVGDTSLASSQLRFAPTPPFADGARGWSGYAGFSARSVARNELIGRDYDPFGPELARHRAVSRVAVGVALTRAWGVVTLDLVSDSREFEGQTDRHRFGSLAVHLDF